MTLVAGGMTGGGLRILYASDLLLPSTEADTEQVMSTIAALTRRGIDVELLAMRPRGDGALDAAEIRAYYQVTGDFEITQLDSWVDGPRILQKALHAVRFAKNPLVSADLVYTRNLPLLLMALASGHRAAYEHYRNWPDQVPPLEPLLRHAIAHPRFLGGVFHSKLAADSFRRIGLTDDKCAVILNGWDPARMEPRLERAEARAKIGLPIEGFIVTYSGRINARKGLDVVLEMARLVPEATFLLVGAEGESAIEREAASIANVRVIPWQKPDATVRYLYASDVLLVPPSLEPLQRHGTTVLPLKLFLYLAAGRAILGPRAPDTAELLTDGVNAALVEPGNAAAAAKRLRELLADPAARERLVAGARATAASLTWDARAERIECFLHARLQAPQAATPATSAHWSGLAWTKRSLRWAQAQVQDTWSDLTHEKP